MMKDGNRLITIASERNHYGNAFMISKKWKDNVNSYWKISDRISVLQLKTSKSWNRNTEVKITTRHKIEHVRSNRKFSRRKRVTKHSTINRDIKKRQ